MKKVVTQTSKKHANAHEFMYIQLYQDIDVRSTATNPTWYIGILEYWNNIEYWNIRILGKWNIGILVTWCFFVVFVEVPAASTCQLGAT